VKNLEIKIVNDGFDQLPQRLDALYDLVVKLSEKVYSNKSENPNENELLTRQETADYFKVDISTIHNWTIKGKLKPYNKGKRVYFKKSEFFSQKQN
jgi:hypothetical protein